MTNGSLMKVKRIAECLELSAKAVNNTETDTKNNFRHF